MTHSLQDKIAEHDGSVFDMLYNAPGRAFGFPVAPEFTNWPDEQRAWRDTAIFQDMSFHMTEHYFEGPDVIKLLSWLGINSFATFGEMQAKQYVVCNPDGYYIGDAVLTCEEKDKVLIVGKPPVGNWVAYHAETGDFDVTLTDVNPPAASLAARRLFRYQIQGPTAEKILEAVTGGPLPEIGFFKMGRFKIGPHEVTALNHRMTGAPGYEFWGPSSAGPEVKELVLEAGKAFGLKQLGGRSYPVTAVESGWVGSALPAVFSGDKMQAYREWLPAAGFEGAMSVGGSNVSDRIEDFYQTPYELGYGRIIKFDHDFIGRDALEKMAAEKKRKKVRLVWNRDDVLEVYGSMMGQATPSKRMEMPMANYATSLQDLVYDGPDVVGVGYYPVYSVHAGGWLTLAAIDEDLAVDGKELTVMWGEPDGGSRKPTVERHAQRRVRVVVDTKPIKRD